MQSYFSLRRLSALWSEGSVDPLQQDKHYQPGPPHLRLDKPRSASFSISSTLSDPAASSSSTLSSASSTHHSSSSTYHPTSSTHPSPSSTPVSPSSPYLVDYATSPSHTPGGFVRAVRLLAQERSMAPGLHEGGGIRRGSHAGEVHFSSSSSSSSSSSMGNPYASSPVGVHSGRKPSLPISIYGMGTGGSREVSSPTSIHFGGSTREVTTPTSIHSETNLRDASPSPLQPEDEETSTKQRAIFLSIRVMRTLPTIVQRDLQDGSSLPINNSSRSTMAHLIASRLYTLWSLSHLPSPHHVDQERAMALRDARIARAGPVITQLDCGLEADYAVRYALDRVFQSAMSTSKKVSMVEMAREALAKAVSSEGLLSEGERRCMYRFHQLVGASGCRPVTLEDIEIILGLEEEEEENV
ncbi:hypothetical protein BJ684DRAFT_15132 [Piptocephalis cylindrospora]|uniref:Uncharacterized protein n=1 Tax=Piptocephalis cylindrospora TaxID=1907219 RepID=A0A4P9Y690_9FUNG|nr:hypothetical protein BJ684DRAFT_15132 [Piptocephalis cylindrospora]|eukprot:RKP14547.1 hypothetical protein BJ684DRAFT_15132 [Piptocephalis cylindrospora]